MLRILLVAHNHPRIFPGGAEVFAYELYRSMRDSGSVEAFLLAGAEGRAYRPRLGTRLRALEDDPNQMLFCTDPASYDAFLGTYPDKAALLRDLRSYLLMVRPDVVHFQHTLRFGYDILRLVRTVLPEARIVYTLHEYLPLCHANGQMLKVDTGENCLDASPDRCTGCFPDISRERFFLRRQFIQSHLGLVDLFVSPSRFLIERYVDWGIDRSRIVRIANGRHLWDAIDETRSGRRIRLGFFGQLNPYKGVLLLLEAMQRLAQAPETKDVHLTLFGSNLQFQQEAFQQAYRSALEEAGSNVTVRGAYRPEELPRLMSSVDWVVIPSIWWENSPLVIQEAFLARRPVICSDIGGMAEKVRDGVDGLHFRARDPADLAATIGRAVSTKGLWETLQRGIGPVFGIDECRRVHEELYRAVLDGTRPHWSAAGAREYGPWPAAGWSLSQKTAETA